MNCGADELGGDYESPATEANKVTEENSAAALVRAKRLLQHWYDAENPTPAAKENS